MKNEGALAGVFSGMRNLSVRCVLPAGKLGPGCRLPTPGESCRRPCPRIRAAIGLHGGANGPSPSYRTRWEERALPIVRDEFRPAIPRRVARQQSPLPLHRHGQDKPLVASGQSKYHRTVDSVLTVCLTKRGNRSRTLLRHVHHVRMPCRHAQGRRTPSSSGRHEACVAGARRPFRHPATLWSFLAAGPEPQATSASLSHRSSLNRRIARASPVPMDPSSYS